MSPWAFRAALRATARVAMGVTAAAGCGGTVASAPETPSRVQTDASEMSFTDAAARADSPAVVEASQGDALRQPEVCDTPPVSDLLPGALHPDAGAGIDPGTFACCVAQVSAFGSADAGVPIGDLPDSGSSGEQVTACCAAIVARLDYEERTGAGSAPDASAWLIDENAAAAVHWACCADVGEPEGPTCTPWGPPTPPAMPARLREVA